jgi:indole-3-glycerol phosphate synthase
MSSILDRILNDKREHIRRITSRIDREELEKSAGQAEPKAFISALQQDGIQLIAEIKPKAPSAGELTDLDPSQIAWVYREEPAVTAVSVLTDDPYFGMTLDDFRRARGILNKPVLRKEFIIDSVQVYRSALAGADAILLIASILDPEQLQELYELSLELGLQPLVEIHSLEEWKSLPIQPELVGINNRTLDDDFSTDLAVTETLAPKLPDNVTIISESGIHDREDILRLEAVEAVDAVLVGTSILENAGSPETVRERVRALMDRQ